LYFGAYISDFEENMNFLAPVALGIWALFATLTVLAAQRWWHVRKMNYLIKGTIDDIKIENNKLYFIIKWRVPSKLREINPNDSLDTGVQFYHHVVRQTPAFTDPQKETDLVNDYIHRHIKKAFYLKARVDNGIVRELYAFEASGRRFIFNLFLLSLFSYGIWLAHAKGWF
jgi:hypothetical protein